MGLHGRGKRWQLPYNFKSAAGRLCWEVAVGKREVRRKQVIFGAF